ncbi:MAG: DUF5009 domain-containing protein [Saprospiraceae bacterium]|nr:DUF5009 domain-containing protein [Saprospiraceae bacterium]MDW8230383.1 DUF5009 domain-containing protein [Saprospiraceae bacterium]
MGTRYLSVDFYRGLTIAFMLVVNTPGTWAHVYSPLLHADWHGCTPTDLVFPSFLFIVGVSMHFSFSKYGQADRAFLLRKALRRAALLFGLGLLLAWYPFWGKSLSELRVLGVLQRIGLCYGLASLLVLYLSPRGVFWISVAILLGYWGVLSWSVAPGADPFSLEDNLARRIDLAVLGAAHLWKGKGLPFDPEGLLSTLPAVVTVLMGWQSGRVMLRSGGEKVKTIKTLSLTGAALVALGWVWHSFFPINKSLWTSSFVLYTGGLSMVLLALSVWVVDVLRWQRGLRFFLVFGANPLFAYLLSGLLVKTMLSIRWMEGEEKMNAYRWLYQRVFVPIEPYKAGSLLFALFFLMVCWSVCWVLYRRGIYIKI